MAENKENYFLRCALIFVFSSFDTKKKKRNEQVNGNRVHFAWTDR